jgi:hypothetical protein
MGLIQDIKNAYEFDLYGTLLAAAIILFVVSIVIMGG